MKLIENYFAQHQKIFEIINKDEIINAIDIIQQTIKNNKKIITFGNGGSASTAQHFITDWIKMANVIKGLKVRGMSLVDNNGIVTAYANDLNYDDIFSQQLNSICDEGDLCVPISVSGNSKNVILGTQTASKIGANTIGFLGFDGGKLKEFCQHSILVPSNDMQICEDVHLMIGHIIMKKIIS